jgi:hypothetical protein
MAAVSLIRSQSVGRPVGGDAHETNAALIVVRHLQPWLPPQARVVARAQLGPRYRLFSATKPSVHNSVPALAAKPLTSVGLPIAN